MTRMREVSASRRFATPVAAMGLIAAVALAACGSDNGTCDYLFANVPTADDCGGGRDNPIEGSLQNQFDCGNAVYTPSSQGCKLISCQVCTDVPSD